MSLVRTTDRLELPETLQNQLYDFRKLVWTIKMIEAVCGAAAGVLVAFLALFVLDRLGDTPGWARLSLFGLTVVSCACIPLAAAPLGLAESAIGTTGSPADPQASACRRPAAGHYRACPERLRAGALASTVRRRHSPGCRRCAKARLPRFGAKSTAPFMGRARFDSSRRVDRPFDGLPVCRNQRLGPAVGPLAGDAALHLRRSRQAARSRRRGARRADFAGSASRPANDHETRRSLRAGRRACVGRRTATRGKLRFRPAASDRAQPRCSWPSATGVSGSASNRSRAPN